MCKATFNGKIKYKYHSDLSNTTLYIFKFGTNYGKWQGILASFGIEPIFVTPQKWQKSYGELPKIKKERKNEMKNIARKLSGLKVTLKTADAILIAIYGYSQYMQVNE